ncbi:MAG: hypothetical protein ACXABK_03345 [Candidatus Heimdallarchaeaceae archaeon]|jgi:carboxyl-terminal processing protease
MQKECVSLDTRIFILSKAYSLVNSYFVHRQDCLDLDIDQLYQKTIQKVIEAENSYDFFLAMQEFMAPLNNSHTLYFDFQLMPFIRGDIGFNFKNVEGKWIVTQSNLDSLQMGDIIELIDGETIDNYYKRMKKYISSSGERARLNFFCSQSYLFPIEFSLTLEDNRTLVINQKEILEKIIPPEVSGKWLEEGKVAYIRIPNFLEPKMENKALELVEEYFDSNVIVIDLRGNLGGSSPRKLTKKLMNRPYKWWLESTKQHHGIFNF